ncbi:MAG: peptidoglycan editing factor PgeF [Patescibacteria group bacterium]|nr:peptidoglycan editing factor PgeF [Patescibacteria group bacterium]
MFYNFDLFKKHKTLQTYFSQKLDGSMKLTNNSEILRKISRNRSAYFLKNNIDPSKVVSAEIVHGSRVKIVGNDEGGKTIGGADGLIARSKDVYLSITSADCLPIFLFEPEKEIVGMVHAGWRSLANNILPNAIEKMKDIGSIPKNILAGIGPAICQKHYEVGPEVAGKFSDYPSAILEENTKIFLNFKKIAELQLLESGFKKENIEVSPECTFELSEKYFSARRDSSLTNCPTDNIIKSQRIEKYRDQQLVRDKKEVEAMIAVIGMKK